MSLICEYNIYLTMTREKRVYEVNKPKGILRKFERRLDIYILMIFFINVKLTGNISQHSILDDAK